MKRSEIKLPEYFDRYINMADDVELMEALQISLHELENAPIKDWETIGNAVYSAGKWTIKDILQHIIDTERVFSYRALSFARGEKEVRSFDEESYSKMANANARNIIDLLEEAILLRKTTILLFKSFSTEILEKTGIGFKGEYSVHSIGFIVCGHQRWHFKIIEDRYMPIKQTA